MMWNTQVRPRSQFGLPYSLLGTSLDSSSVGTLLDANGKSAQEKITLRPYQVEGAEFARTHHAFILADRQGSGKTIEILAAARELKGPILVICRPLAKPYWRKMIRLMDPDAPVAHAVQGGIFSKKVAGWFNPRQRGYLLIHHEALSTPRSRKTETVTRNVAADLRKYGFWEAIIADEAHRFKNRESQMTQSLKTLDTWNKWALTGTPMEKSPADYWSLLNWFAPHKFFNYWDFFDTFVEFERRGRGQKKPIGVRNLDLLGRMLTPYYLRRENIPMPSLTVTDVPLKLGEKQQAIYERFEEEVLIELGDPEDDMFIANMLVRMFRLKQVALDPVLVKADAPSVKIDWLRDWVQDNDEPFVVFTESREFANLLPVLLPGGLVISGSQSQEVRDERVAAFMDGNVPYIVGTMATMSESVNLQRASVAIFTDLHRSATMMDQAEKRIHRMDSPGPVRILRLIALNTVDLDYQLALEMKMDNIQAVHFFVQRAQGRLETRQGVAT